MKARHRIAAALLAALTLALSAVPASALGDVNGTNDSGLLGLGNESNFWSPGKEGIRVSVWDARSVSRTGAVVDYSNSSYGSGVWHCGKVSKIGYQGVSNGTEPFKGGYTSYALPGLPKVIPESGENLNIDVMKEFISRESTLRTIASYAGVSYGTLTDGAHKILIEPIAYFYYFGEPYALTATEAGFLDQYTVGDLHSRMGNLTSRQLPLSMFLERTELGIPSASGTGGGFVQRQQIIDRYGSLVWRHEGAAPGAGGAELPPAPVPPRPVYPLPAEYLYHTDKDVYTTAEIRNTSGTEDCTGGLSARLHITGDRGFSATVASENSPLVPRGSTSLVWFRWHTDPEAQNYSMTVTTGSESVVPTRSVIRAVCVGYGLAEPPDPRPEHRKGSWRLPSLLPSGPLYGPAPAPVSAPPPAAPPAGGHGHIQRGANDWDDDESPLPAPAPLTPWGEWTYGREETAAPAQETVWYCEEHPSFVWSKMSSLQKVEKKSQIPTPSGAYMVYDRTEMKEVRQKPDHVLIIHQGHPLTPEEQSNPNHRYSFVSHTVNGYTPWQDAGTITGGTAHDPREGMDPDLTRTSKIEQKYVYDSWGPWTDAGWYRTAPANMSNSPVGNDTTRYSCYEWKRSDTTTGARVPEKPRIGHRTVTKIYGGYYNV